MPLSRETTVAESKPFFNFISAKATVAALQRPLRLDSTSRYANTSNKFDRVTLEQ